MKKLPKIISKDEFEKLFKAALKSKNKNRKQYALCMLLGFEAGLRISEIVGWQNVPVLTKDKIDLDGHTIRLESAKGGKDRIVPLPKRFNSNALRMLPIKLTRRAIQYYVTNLGKKVLNKEISFHTLRHGFGTHLAQNGIPLHQIQMLMGHSRLDTTGIYLHANPKKAIEGARSVF